GYELACASGYNLDYQIAARTWLLGRNLLAMQAADILSAYRYLKQASPSTEVYLVGKGKFGPAAILAAALEPGFRRILLESSVISFASILESPLQSGNENAIVPGLLSHFDLPDLVTMLGTRSLFWVSNTNASRAQTSALSPTLSFSLRGEGWSLQRTAKSFLSGK
ncbi:MAG: hypothetical protein NTW74_14455, partial [Acidobacteria bacterium]|nr:hypothetical protein [Acidobacteriota bacterium]